MSLHTPFGDLPQPPRPGGTRRAAAHIALPLDATLAEQRAAARRRCGIAGREAMLLQAREDDAEVLRLRELIAAHVEAAPGVAK